MKMNLQYFGGRGSSGGKSSEKTPSSMKIGTEVRLPSGALAYKFGSNNWVLHTNGASFTTAEKMDAAMSSRRGLSNSEIKRRLKNS